MVILKVFNNNSVAAISDTGSDIILVGSGIGFRKKSGDQVDPSRIERTYVFQDDSKQRFEQSLEMIPAIYFEITEHIIEKARRVLNTEFSSEIFITVSDHISYAVKRQEEGTFLPNILLNETKTLYQREFEVGLWALRYVKKRINVELREDEAGYIALHLVNFSKNKRSNRAMRIVTLTKQILEMIHETMHTELDEDSLEYARISIHLKFLAERIFRQEEKEVVDTTKDIRDVFLQDPRMELCLERIEKVVKEYYDYELTPDEKTYLCIHIRKNIT